LLYMVGTTTSQMGTTVVFKTRKITDPTVTMYSPTTGASGKVRDYNGGADVTPTTGVADSNFFWYAATGAPTATFNTQGHWVADARF
jgi:hypothetical protein